MAENRQIQLTFGEGMTNVPSDALCSDNALAESVGMVYDDGEHKVIQEPVEYVKFGSGVNPLTLLYVHKFNGEERYIGWRHETPGGYCLRWGTRGVDGTFTFAQGQLIPGGVDTDTIQVTSVGKTLVVKNGDDIIYFLWKADNTYNEIGKIPEPVVEFKIHDASVQSDNFSREQVVSNTGKADFMNVAVNIIGPAESAQEDYNNLVVGLYEKNLKAIHKRKHFAEPFVLRYAVELFDGSYIMQSAPIMLFPAITKNTYGVFTSVTHRVTLTTHHAELIFKAKFDYSEWDDIVKGVVVFASEGIPVYDTTDDQECEFLPSSRICHDIIKASSLNGMAIHGYNYAPEIGLVDRDLYVNFRPLNERGAQDILDDLKSASIFYKIFSIGAKGSDTWEKASSYIKSKVLENITSQERLTDDYFSHCALSSVNMTTYNYRLILSNVRRGFYEGASSFLPYHNSTSYLYHVYVYIKTSSGDRVVEKTLDTNEKQGIYFFYPDPRAYKAIIFVGSNGDWLCTLDLKEHPYLNGAYYFGQLPDGTETEPSGASGHTPSQQTCQQDAATKNVPEILSNQIWTSEANNPFVFRADGNMSVGNGTIIGVSSLTQALSQGQFGQYPLVIFADDGVWAASTGSTGLFTAVHPMSREVCNNARSITQTDGAVFFTSKKGLMVVVGAEAKCVSEQLSGKTDSYAKTAFADTALADLPVFLEQCVIAYDYRDSLLWLFNAGASCCYVYAIKSGTFTKCSHLAVNNVVNNYPDYLLQTSTSTNGGKAYSLTERGDINSADEQAKNYAAHIMTRPMSLGSPYALKSIRQVRNIMAMQGSVTLRIYGSNDLTAWRELNNLRGTPWKYYRFRYDFTNLKATDRFVGAAVITQERRTNKLR